MGSGWQRELDPAESVLHGHCAIFRQQGTKMASSWAVYVKETHSRPQNVRIMQTWMTPGYKTACKYTLLERRGVMCSVGDGWRPSQPWKVKVILCFAVVLTACALNQSWRGSKINCAASSLLCVSSAGHVCEACPLIVGINTVAEDVRHRWALKRPAPSPLV